MSKGSHRPAGAPRIDASGPASTQATIRSGLREIPHRIEDAWRAAVRSADAAAGLASTGRTRR